MEKLIIFTLAYLIGSIPTGYILVRLVKGIDIRTIGSGSTGATNVKRVLGTKAFFAVMLLDVLKGLLPVLLSKNFGTDLIPVLAATGVIIGHSKSVFLKFTGGKSVASGVGTIFGLYWATGLITAITWIFITYRTKYVSAGSIIALLLSGVWMLVFKQPVSYIIYCFLAAIYISFYLHGENIQRLKQGSESKVID